MPVNNHIHTCICGIFYTVINTRFQLTPIGCIPGTIKKYAEKIIKGIRTYDKKAVILVGTPNWSQDVDFIVSEPMLKLGKEEHLRNFYNELLNKDWFMTLLDLKDYIKVKDQVFADYEDRNSWAKKMLANIGEAGFFSSDRTIAQYNKDIWHLN